MNMPLRKFDTTTAYLYDCAFDLQLPAQDYEIGIDCLSQPNPWQALKSNQRLVDKLSSKVTTEQQQTNRVWMRIRPLLVTLSKSALSNFFQQMPTIISQLSDQQHQIKRLDSTLARLKRINAKQRKLLKQLKKQRRDNRDQPAEAIFKDHINEIEADIFSLWQRCIGAELERIRIQQSNTTLRRQLIEIIPPIQNIATNKNP